MYFSKSLKSYLAWFNLKVLKLNVFDSKQILCLLEKSLIAHLLQ